MSKVFGVFVAVCLCMSEVGCASLVSVEDVAYKRSGPDMRAGAYMPKPGDRIVSTLADEQLLYQDKVTGLRWVRNAQDAGKEKPEPAVDLECPYPVKPSSPKTKAPKQAKATVQNRVPEPQLTGKPEQQVPPADTEKTTKKSHSTKLVSGVSGFASFALLIAALSAWIKYQRKRRARVFSQQRAKLLKAAVALTAAALAAGAGSVYFGARVQ